MAKIPPLSLSESRALVDASGTKQKLWVAPHDEHDPPKTNSKNPLNAGQGSVVIVV